MYLASVKKSSQKMTNSSNRLPAKRRTAVKAVTEKAELQLDQEQAKLSD